jgi:osmoprotectant transport system ATP-binding protein
MIELDHVSKAFGGRPVVDDLSLTVPDGAFCVVLGPSGCGKSATLRMINRLVPFDSGVIRIAGEDVRSVPPARWRPIPSCC